MNLFSVRKLYVDCVDQEGTVWIFYVVDLRIPFLRQRLAGVERYPVDGPATLHRVSGCVAWPTQPGFETPVCFRWRLPGGFLNFEGVSRFPSWKPGGVPPLQPFRWQVLSPRLDVCLTYPDSKHALSGVGYADFVEIRQPPRSLGVRRLCWGRSHGPDGVFVFTSVDSAEISAWQRAAYWRDDSRIAVSDTFLLQEKSDGLSVRVDDLAPGAPREFHFGRRQILREGEAMDRSRFPRLFERLCYRLMMGAAKELRWSDFARNGNITSATSAIHESVEFGARPVR